MRLQSKQKICLSLSKSILYIVRKKKGFAKSTEKKMPKKAGLKKQALPSRQLRQNKGLKYGSKELQKEDEFCGFPIKMPKK